MNKEAKVIRSTGEKTIRGIFSVMLFIVTLSTILVIGITVLNSFKTKGDLIKNTFGIPTEFTLESFKKVLTQDHFVRYFLNSIILTLGGISLLIFLASMTAYGLSRYKFKMKGAVQTYFMLGLMFPIQLGLLPLFIILRSLGLLNNLLGLILLYGAGMSFPVFVFSKFFSTIPAALEESARLDGAGEFTIYWKIILPICKPVLATIALINSVTIWNDFYMPLVFLSKASVRTLTLGVYKYMESFLKNWNYAFAAVVVTLIPVILLYFMFSKQIVAGLTGGAVKE